MIDHGRIALANSYMELAVRAENKKQGLWERTPNGWCHSNSATEEYANRVKYLKREAISRYA